MANPNWVKGVSGNPSGMSKDGIKIGNLAKVYTQEALDRLAFWMRSPNPRASVASAIALIERAWGKPAQTLVAQDGDGQAIPYSIIVMQAKPKELGHDGTETVHH